MGIMFAIHILNIARDKNSILKIKKYSDHSDENRNCKGVVVRVELIGNF